MEKASIFTSTDILHSGDYLKLEKNHVMNEKVLSLSFMTNGFFTDALVRAGHGEAIYGGSYIELTATALRVYNYTTEPTLIKEEEHGINISGSVNLVIRTHLCTADVTVFSSDNLYVIKGVSWSGRNGEIFATAVGTDIFEPRMRWHSFAYEHDVWVLGDSYLNSGAKARWPYYLKENGYTRYLLLGYPGRNSTAGIADFKQALLHGTPKYAVWCLGMNDTDIDNAISQSYKNAVDEFLDICKEKSITPILSTIPCTPKVENLYKNEWVRASGYRYVDFARAVGAINSLSPWTRGMLSSDNIHPAELGAKALYAQFIADFPEILK